MNKKIINYLLYVSVIFTMLGEFGIEFYSYCLIIFIKMNSKTKNILKVFQILLYIVV